MVLLANVFHGTADEEELDDLASGVINVIDEYVLEHMYSDPLKSICFLETIIAELNRALARMRLRLAQSRNP
jgi:hypothetical protein